MGLLKKMEFNVARCQRRCRHRQAVMSVVAVLSCLTATIAGTCGVRAESFSSLVARVQPKIVKVFGAGGFRGLEHYQSGFLVSPNGHVLTVWSYVLDADQVTVVLDDGRRYEAQLVGNDPRLEIAVLKIEGDELPFFALGEARRLEVGERVLAFSNLFGVAAGSEAASVQHGHVAAITTLTARRGAFETPYRGSVYVLDAMTNNPGSAGGALTDDDGRLAGMLGKELRNALDHTWLNYAIPVHELADSVTAILEGRHVPVAESSERRKAVEPVTPRLLGLIFVPNVLPKTPPFVDQVLPGSAAERAGLRPDDLVLYVNGRTTTSLGAVLDELSYIDRLGEVQLMIQRGQDLIEVSLFADVRDR